MTTRLHAGAEHTMRIANRIAAKLGRKECDAEHILLAFLQADNRCPVAKVLHDADLTYDNVRAYLTGTPDLESAHARLPLTAEARQVLSRATVHAKKLRHTDKSYHVTIVRTEDLGFALFNRRPIKIILQRFGTGSGRLAHALQAILAARLRDQAFLSAVTLRQQLWELHILAAGSEQHKFAALHDDLQSLLTTMVTRQP